MNVDQDVLALADALNGLATLYQFRSLDERLYGTLTVSQSYCLRILYFQSSQKMSELAARLQVRLSTMTGIVDQLEGKGLVKRLDHPHDRRSLHVTLTPEGRQLYKSAHEAFLSHIEPLLARRTTAERRKLLAFLAETTEALRGWMENPRKVKRRAEKHS